ncbi:MAG: crotonase/enoyl-CoA hydratase family protein [Candidatus Protistobacter heckmanni]|nr:crotonase/enoyl-CoA hydratase family protein [Candidatus Protistobacter heckmanni]
MQSLTQLEMRGAQGNIACIRLTRPEKRNALNDGLIEALHTHFDTLPAEARVAVIHAEGDHFCAGLDLSELRERDAVEGLFHSRRWHAAFERIQFGPVPVIVALKGAVVGGGLELACAAHIRVADASCFYALPEGSRGLFVGGGDSVRIPRLIGVPRMTDMMLTGRVLAANEGHAAGVSHYLELAGGSFDKALTLAERIATNAPMSNYSVMHVLPRIADQGMDQGLMMESLIAAIAQSSPEAKDRLKAFLEGRAAKVR